MSLQRVTITGADDNSKYYELYEISQRYPFVEWGILVSRSREDSPRFPSREWIKDFSQFSSRQRMFTSMHVCGHWTRQILVGTLDWTDLPDIVRTAQRVQMNTHSLPHVVKDEMITCLLKNNETYVGEDREFIFQWDDLNKNIATLAQPHIRNVSMLFDLSGGAGIVPKNWVGPHQTIPCGYAGGLGPDNVLSEIERIEKVLPENYNYWIDMERNVRTEDDSTLDLEKVCKVLSLCEPLIK